jgi:hypothetical protein
VKIGAALKTMRRFENSVLAKRLGEYLQPYRQTVLGKSARQGYCRYAG